MNSTALATRLRSALKELQKFRKFFAALPADAVNLNVVMMNPRTTSTLQAIDLAKNAKNVHRCGSVGCLAGWAMVWTDRTFGNPNYDYRLGLHLLRPSTDLQYAMGFSSSRQRPRVSPRREALDRLTSLRKGLMLDLAHATKRSQKAG